MRKRRLYLANLLLALAFVIALSYGYRIMDKLDQFLDSGRINSDDTEE
mgnify:CR=1 FL=1